MADTISANKSVVSVVATRASRIKDLAIKNGQLVFIQDNGKIAFDFNGNRVFYNQIEELNTEQDRIALASPSCGYYFVIDTAVLWYYDNRWIQITTPPKEILFFGVDVPSLGSANTLYVDSVNKKISVWDEEANKYVVVADKTETIDEDDISSLFD